MDKLNKTKKTSLGLKIKNFIIRDVWDSSLTQKRGLKSTAITLLRIIITTINGIVIGQVGYENFDVTWVEYTGYMFLLFTAIVTFFYHNANEVGTKAKRKKKDEKKN